MKLTFTYSTLFSQDLIDVINVFDSYKNEDNSCEFESSFLRWAYTPYSVARFYRRTLLVEKVGHTPRVIEFDSKEALEELISGLLYEDEYEAMEELTREGQEMGFYGYSKEDS